ncbi:MAG: transporter substrate-binding domain-containing protein [Actinomycetota bacterium]|nr:transporter substrate-binding domain-containing protein [Actinomycetota bacterium]
MRNHRTVLSLLTGLAALTLTLAACGGSEERSGTATGPSDQGACSDASEGDLLAEVCERGTLTVSTDPAYPPQSSFDKDSGGYEGFDIDVATEIAARLGVEVAWEEPAWEVLTAGRWNDRWQMSVGSMTPTNDRQRVLNFTEPYYFTPAVVVVHEDNTSVSDVTTDLDGAEIGVCSACTYEQYLNKSLVIKGFEFDFMIDDATVTGYDTDTTALQDLSLGDGARLDAVITSLTTAQRFAADQPVKIVGEPVFYEPLSVAIDKNSQADPASFTEAVDTIVGEMHEDGTLTELSKKWYDGVDLSVQQ